jgi:hypothetical protein
LAGLAAPLAWKVLLIQHPVPHSPALHTWPLPQLVPSFSVLHALAESVGLQDRQALSGLVAAAA